jgi:aspartate 1-decarboxylase
MISLNGSAERRAQLGDQVIIAAFAMVNETELAGGWRPKLVFVDDSNKGKSSRDHVPTQSFIQQDVDTLTDRPMQV